jgi:probable HAF family extracellular repeat protein
MYIRSVFNIRQGIPMPLRYICFLLCFFPVCASRGMAQGTYTEIDFPSALMTQANAVNRAGTIVGSYTDLTGGHGFLLQDGVYTTIDYPGAQYSYALGINDKGQIVGLAEPVGYLYDLNSQSFTSIQYPRALYSYPVAINNASSIAGYFQKRDLVYQGFEVVNRGFAEIVPPNSTAAFVTGIDTVGDLFGYAQINGSYSNFLFRQGQFRTINIPASAAFVLGTNPAGTALVGYYQAFSGTKGFVLRNRVLQTLSFPGAITTIASGINASGEVVGYFIDSSDVTHGFLWKP